ncbi:MAG: DoxX family protein [Rhizobiaceae bacterium]
MLETALGRLTSPFRCAASLLFRIATSLIFIVGGLGHFFRSDEMVARMHGSPSLPWIEFVGDPLLLLQLSGGVFVVAGLLLVVGWSTRLAAAALFVTLIPITITIHVAPGHEGPLFKNVAILGSLLFLVANGAGCIALDRLRTRVAMSSPAS